MAPSKAFPLSEVRPTAFSNAGGHYVVANGKTVDNEGEMIVQGKDVKYQPRGIVFQAAKVTKPLFAGAQAAPAGFRTILDQDEEGNNISHMIHKTTGEVTPLDIDNGVYCFDLWVEDGSAHSPSSGFARPGNP